MSVRSFVTRKIVIGGVGLVASGGIAAATIPALAAPAASSGSPAATAPQGHAHHRSVGHTEKRFARALVAATVKETGLPRATVLKDLRAGQTLAQIAGPKAQAVENDVIAAVQARLQKAVSAGRFTQQKADSLLAAARARITTLMATDLSKAFHAQAKGGAATTTA